MLPTTPHDARVFLHALFEQLFDPAVPSEAIGAYFHPDYQQLVDGKILNFTDFIAHVGVLKSTLASAQVTFEQILVNGQEWADIHYVDAVKQDGSRLRVKVLAFYIFRDGKISRIEELTHLEQGSAVDQDLGSRL